MSDIKRGKVTIRTEVDLEAIDQARRQRFYELNPTERMRETCTLIEMSLRLGHKKPLSGKGLVIRKGER
jgi:hypothetical protein